MNLRLRSALGLSAIVAAFAAGTGALACGMEDPNSISTRRGLLNFVYPESLHVGTAIWQAQMAGVLPKDAASAHADAGSDNDHEAELKASGELMKRLSRKLGAREPAASHGLAVVLIGPVLWTRFSREQDAVEVIFHADGPAKGDEVIATDEPVVQAIIDDRLTLERAIELRLARVYGGPDPQQTSQQLAAR
jgi:hypothetical protein